MRSTAAFDVVADEFHATGLSDLDVDQFCATFPSVHASEEDWLDLPVTSHLLNRVPEYVELPRFAYAWELGGPDRAFAGELDGE